jgi:hypothetical protein
MPAFRQKNDLYSFDWGKVSTSKSTNRATEQVFSYAGLPVARKTNELEPIYYADMAELAATTFTVAKYTLSTMFSHELLKDNQHLPDLMKEAGATAGESQSYIRDQVVAAIFNRAFNSSYTMYDGVELCGSHTMNDGTTYDNDLTPASITFDNVWSMINHFETAPYSHSGLMLTDTPEYLIYHPSKEKEVQAILQSTQEPGTADNDKNTIQNYNLKPLSCRHLSTTTNWFIAGSKFKNDFLFFNREAVQTDTDDDFDRMAVKFRSFQRFAVGVRDFLWLVGNPGA